MREPVRIFPDLPPEQQTIRAKCFHPSGSYIEFTKEEVEQSITARFDKQVALYPDRIAIKSKNDTLTYAELNQAANRIAWTLLKRKGGSERPVGILLEDGAATITAFLGVLKAGKICVPLDPSCSRGRLGRLLKDSLAESIVTDAKHFESAAAVVQDAAHLVNIDNVDQGASPDNPNRMISPEAAAYVLYTSGSTGEPKGVIQNHRNSLFEVRRLTNSFHICREDRLSHLLSCRMSGGVREILSALLNGAALYPFDLKKESFTSLANFLIQEQITICRFVPSSFSSFARVLTGKQEFPKLRLVYVGGEVLRGRDVKHAVKYFSPPCILVNVYGATETGIIRQFFMSAATAAKRDGAAREAVPVGYACESMEIFLADDKGRVLGPDQVGEIAVKSAYLSPGYWQKAGLTNAAFLPDPQGGQESTYFTGDLGLMRTDGCLVYAGRKDFQVKIRGHRVEVAEVEAALLGLETIKEAVVVAREDRAGEPRLVAYLVPHEEAGPSAASLRHILKEKLPEYMIPSAFVLLESLPLTPNGKLDRRALPTPDRKRPELAVSFAPPQAPTEKLLADIFEAVLDLNPVGIHDDFFDLGGDSLLATQVVSRVRKSLSIDLPLRILFERPTIKGLAARIGKVLAKTVTPEGMAGGLADLKPLAGEEAERAPAQELRRGK